MKFKNLKQTDIDYARRIYKDKSMTFQQRMNILTDYFEKDERTIRRWFSKKLEGFKEKEDIVVESEHFKLAKLAQIDKGRKYYLISSAQNNTLPNAEFIKNIEAYSNFLKGQLILVPYRYKNPTSIFSKADKESEFWHPSLVKYLNANRIDLNSKLTVLGDIKIQPTNSDPLRGIQGISSKKSCILAHPSIHFKTMHVLEGYDKKFMMTTGSVTKENYTDTLLGKKGSFNHTYSFVIVEIVNEDKFYCRQVTANSSGSFTDLHFKVSNGEVKKINSCGAVVFGDIHSGDHNKKVVDCGMELCKKINPEHIVLHDLFNAKSINHHEFNNPFIQYELEKENKNSLKKEIDEMLNWLEQLNKFNVVVVKSNHDDFVSTWLMQDWRKMSTCKNSIEYVKFASILLEGKAKNGIIPYLINEKFPKIKCLTANDSFIVNSWELAQHSSVGSSGTRGSLNSYSSLSIKCVLGHGHTATRKMGTIMVGTFTNLRVGYNNGPSNWVNSLVIIHNDKKAQLIIMDEDGKFTTLK